MNEHYSEFDYENAFIETINAMEFSLLKYEDGSFGLYDLTDANFGGIENDRFTDAAQIINRFINNTYFEDYFFDGAENDIEDRLKDGTINLPNDFEMPVTSEEWVNFLETYHETETYFDVYQAAKFLSDYDNVIL